MTKEHTHIHTRNQKGEAIGPTDAYLLLLNELMESASPMGAYYMGAASVLAWRQKLQPDRTLLYAASVASGIHGLAVIFDKWATDKLLE